ncbi:nucleotide exchange factor GrpE [Caldiplasma sukawensis]
MPIYNKNLYRFINPLDDEMEKSKRRKTMHRVNIEGESIEELKDRNKKLTESIVNLQNYLRITEKQNEVEKNKTVADMLKSFLPILDSLDAAILSGKEKSTYESIRKTILGTLNKYGFSEIKSEGEKLNLDYHEVVGVVEGQDDNIVVKELQKGYTINGSVLRTAKVIVSKKE